MLSGNPYYFSSIRKVVVGIGAMFNNLKLVGGGQTIKVPLAYAAREAYWSKLHEQDATGNRLFETTLPRMSFYMTGLDYDPTRQKNALNRNQTQSTTNPNNLFSQLQPIPYNLAFEVIVYTREIEDSLQLIEQILPTFTPSYNLSLNMIPQMNFSQDVPIVLDGVTTEDNYEEGLSGNRIITWNLALTAKSNLYPPVVDSARISKQTTTTFLQPSMTTQLEQIGVAVVPLTAKITDPHTISTTIA